MKISCVTVDRFRNMTEQSFSPGKGVNVIYGDNGQGKTNLIEAMWLFSGARSFRGAKEQELIPFGGSFVRMSLAFSDEQREQTAEIAISGEKKLISLNSVQLLSRAKLADVLHFVVFAPNHLSLVKEGPAGRRDFIDSCLCRMKPSYIETLYRFTRTVSHRNSLLKDIQRTNAPADTLDIWDERMAFLSAGLLKERAAFCEKLSPMAAAFYKGLSKEKESISLCYRSTFSDAGRMLKSNIDMSLPQPKLACELLYILGAMRKNDIAACQTTVGPHRDDLNLNLNAKPARAFASQGQSRSIALCLKLAEGKLLQSVFDDAPVMLLDDVLSELDKERRAYLLRHISGMQTFITCCDKQSFRGKETRFFHMRGGVISEV